MIRIRSLGVVGLAGVAVLTGCDLFKDKQLKKDVEALKLRVDSLETWLGEGDSLNVYLVYLAEAVCELEKRTPGIPIDKRICPKDPPHDIKPPPSYPPK